MDAVWDVRSDGFGDRTMRDGNFGGECGALHCNQWGVCGITVQKCVKRHICGLGWCVGSTEALAAIFGNLVIYY